MDGVTTLFNGASHSDSYAAYRPSYPESLFERLAELTEGRGLAWDVACGTGQASVPLSRIFDKVLATDVSSTQIEHAPRRENIRYDHSNASAGPEELERLLGLKSASVDLITVAQALHWFDHERFYANVKHFLKAGGVFSAWTYALTPWFEEDDKAIEMLHQEVLDVPLGQYWPPQREFIDRNYDDIPIPFSKILDFTSEPLSVSEMDWRIEDMLGYLSSLSAYQVALKTGVSDPIADYRDKITKLWGSKETRRVRFPIYLLAGRY